MTTGSPRTPLARIGLFSETKPGSWKNPCSFRLQTLPLTVDPNTGASTGTLITGNAERWDVIVDFSNFASQDIILYTDAPAPFPFGDDRNDYYFGNSLNPASPTQQGFGPDTRSIMRFRVAGAITSPADPPLTIDHDN